MNENSSLRLEELRNILKNKKFSMRKLGRELGLSAATPQKWFEQNRWPARDEQRICQILNLTPDHFTHVDQPAAVESLAVNESQPSYVFNGTESLPYPDQAAKLQALFRHLETHYAPVLAEIEQATTAEKFRWKMKIGDRIWQDIVAGTSPLPDGIVYAITYLYDIKEEYWQQSDTRNIEDWIRHDAIKELTKKVDMLGENIEQLLGKMQRPQHPAKEGRRDEQTDKHRASGESDTTV